MYLKLAASQVLWLVMTLVTSNQAFTMNLFKNTVNLLKTRSFKAELFFFCNHIVIEDRFHSELGYR